MRYKGFSSIIICSTEGIDVSVWQGTIDWNRVKSEKQFSFIRSSVIKKKKINVNLFYLL